MFDKRVITRNYDDTSFVLFVAVTSRACYATSLRIWVFCLGILGGVDKHFHRELIDVCVVYDVLRMNQGKG